MTIQNFIRELLLKWQATYQLRYTKLFPEIQSGGGRRVGITVCEVGV